MDERKETRGLKRKKAEEVKEGEKQLDLGNDNEEMMRGRGREKEIKMAERQGEGNEKESGNNGVSEGREERKH